MVFDFMPGKLSVVLALIAFSYCSIATAVEPQIHNDRRVTFRIDAPDADRVQIDVKGRTHAANDGQPFDMTRDPAGVWTYTTTPLDPGFHYYFVFVDGFRCADSSNPLYFGWGRPTNGVEIPDPDLDCYVPRQVPRGEVRIRPYFSKLTNAWREARVYTPPGYDPQREQAYPVLYLQHGAGENQTSWSNQGRANVILDNLLAEGRCEPMVVVMDHGYAFAPDGDTSDRRQNLFEQVVIEELIPTIQEHYHVRTDRGGRAIAGLSMGGGQAVAIGLSNLETFSTIGCFSGAVRNLDDLQGALADSQTLNEQLDLFWIGCGTEDRIFPRSQALHEELQQRGIDHEYVAHPGTHEWQTWRRHLHLFAPLLFRE